MNYEDIMTMKQLYVNNINDIFQKRPTEIILGKNIVKKLKALIHQVKDFHRNYMELYIDGIYQAIFSEDIETSAKRQD